MDANVVQMGVCDTQDLSGTKEFRQSMSAVYVVCV